MSDTNNTPAFPVSTYVNVDGETFTSTPTGMTLLDWFAGQALPGILKLSSTSSFGYVANESYRLAAEMLKARKAR